MFLEMILGSPKPRAVPESVRSALREKLGVDARHLDKLKALERNGNYAGRKVRYIRVFDPAALNGAGAKVTYASLDQNKNALVFEGHFEKNGALVITDRRKLVAANQPA